jgi:hypothetical protein
MRVCGVSPQPAHSREHRVRLLVLDSEPIKLSREQRQRLFSRLRRGDMLLRGLATALTSFLTVLPEDLGNLFDKTLLGHPEAIVDGAD